MERGGDGAGRGSGSGRGRGDSRALLSSRSEIAKVASSETPFYLFRSRRPLIHERCPGARSAVLGARLVHHTAHAMGSNVAPDADLAARGLPR